MTIGRIFIVGMLVFGVVVGLVTANMPKVRAWGVPVFVWPLIVSFIVDLVLMRRAEPGQISPLTMAERAIGVIGSALIITVILELT